MGVWAGIDIGGANLKAATSHELAATTFQFWKHPNQLSDQISQLLLQIEPFDRLAVTMTGELADCFESREHGVNFICNAVAKVADAKHPRFYQTTGELVELATAKRAWQQTAASNWHALAAFVAHHVKTCIVVDVGSTTTDLIPILNGKPATRGQTDFSRLAHGELLYVGVNRTPVCSICDSVTIGESRVGVANELFATMLDVYIVLGKTSESADSGHTADGRESTRAAAKRRLAKMVCCDEMDLSDDQIRSLAQQIADLHRKKIAHAMQRIGNQHPRAKEWVLAGEGEWIAEEILLSDTSSTRATSDVPGTTAKPGTGIRSLASLFDEHGNSAEISAVGPAFALAMLAEKITRPVNLTVSTDESSS